jgi:energy-converting hydrogenase Eha subunit E
VNEPLTAEQLAQLAEFVEKGKAKKEPFKWNETHFAAALFALGSLAIFAGVTVQDTIFRAYMEQVADIGVYHVVFAGFFALFGTTSVNIVEKIVDSSMGVAVFMCGYVVGLAVIIAG